MHYSTLATIAAFAAAASAKDHVVQVGENGNKFSPDHVNAEKGDTVSFKIHSDHNVVSSTFSKPCVENDKISSGAVFNGASVDPQYFVVTVNDTDPTWLFCAEEGHCQQGMVFAINPPSSGNTLDKYSSAASSATTQQSNTNVLGGIYANKAGGAGSSSGSSSSSASSSGTSSGTSSASGSSGSSTSSSASASSTGGSSSANATTSGGASSTSSTSTPTSTSGAIGVYGSNGFATSVVLGLAGVFSWFL